MIKIDGTIRDYSEKKVKHFFEIGEIDKMGLNVIVKHLSNENDYEPVDDGYIVNIPIQVVPEIIADLANNNIGVYQVVRNPTDKKGKKE